MNKKEHKGTIGKVVQKGDHGPYVVVYLEDEELHDELGAITFSLSLWEEPFEVEKGMVVVLGRLSAKNKGWRANEVRAFSVKDQVASRKKVNKEKV